MILNLKENSVFLNTGSNLKKSITFRLEVIAKIKRYFPYYNTANFFDTIHVAQHFLVSSLIR